MKSSSGSQEVDKDSAKERASTIMKTGTSKIRFSRQSWKCPIVLSKQVEDVIVKVRDIRGFHLYKQVLSMPFKDFHHLQRYISLLNCCLTVPSEIRVHHYHHRNLIKELKFLISLLSVLSWEKSHIKDPERIVGTHSQKGTCKWLFQSSYKAP